ncbi:type II secretion system protein [Campylobacter sp. RM16188]|uniref:type II secretion system protein n=1 Tax=Campylobacter sp. RM16188 TaxID=1705725 RepID=UPI001555FE32|nr:prepilin-type N-terminal cleavage/methylation domain-containing protein [Campylobacter sp. RM16188]
MKQAFTMIELVFVIVVLGILAGIAAPRLFATRDDAIIAKARADIASIQSAIVNARNTNMLSGRFVFPNLDSSPTSQKLFDNVLQGGIKQKDSGDTSGWERSGTTYTFTNPSIGSVQFTYNIANGTFGCDNTKYGCKKLTE